MTSTRQAALDPGTALEVLEQLRSQLGGVDPEVRAIVALRATGSGSVALADVTLHDNRILEPPQDAAGLVVVTGEQVTAAAEGDREPVTPEAVVALHQLLCVLPDGEEVGIYTAGEDPEPHRWSTADDPEGLASTLRPRDEASNSARRALGLPSVVDLPPMTDILARAWLLAVSTEALRRFDGPDGPVEVTADDLEDVAAQPPLGDLPASADALPTWGEVHAAATDGTLELGRFTVDAEHAAWLDAEGLAQLLDVSLPPTEELLSSLQITGDDDLIGWAIGWLSNRGWIQPS